MKKIYSLLCFLLSVAALSAQCTYTVSPFAANVTCAGGADGSISGTISGATGPYTVSLTPPVQATQTVANNFAFNNLAAGAYTITVVDQLNCTTQLSSTISQPNPITVFGQVTQVSCFGGNNGQIFVNVIGGTPPYNYMWNNGQMGQVVNGLVAGTYNVMVTDANGCTGMAVFTLTQPTQLSATISGDFTLCAGASTAISATASGGTPPYSYLWNLGVTTQVNNVQVQGNHNVTVTDANGCTATASATVTLLPALDAITTYTDETCQGNDGTATSTGGVSYLWSIGAITNAINNLTAGEYWVTVTNADGCEDVDTVMISNPNLVIVFSNLPASCDQADGIIFADVVGNPPAPTYAWSDGQVGPTATGLASGWYSVTITDGAGCQSHRNVFLPEAAGCNATIGGFVYDDAAAPDCVLDGGSVGVANVLVQITNGVETHYTYTDMNGYYEFLVDSIGTWDINVPTPQGFTAICGNDLSATLTFYGEVSNGNHFYFDHSQNNDLMVYLTGSTARPGFPVSYYVTIVNNGGTTISGDVTVNFNDTLTSFFAYVVPQSFTPGSNVAVWTFNNLAPGTYASFSCQFVLPANVPLGEAIYNYASLSPVPADLTPLNNNYTLVQVTTGAFDPNAKSVFPAGEGVDHNVYEVDELVYRIDFQNTGTDTAFTVVLRDTLDNVNLDVFGLEPVASSHPYSMTLEGENVLVFTFENILLVDSNRNEPASHGFVTFRIPVVQPYVGGTVVNNTAAIYFDYNEPVITNNAFVTLAYPVGVNQPYSLAQFSVSPNPATGTAQLSYTLQATDRVECWLSDAMGRRVLQVLPSQLLSADNYTATIPLQGLEAGVYFVTMQTRDGKVTRKVVVF